MDFIVCYILEKITLLLFIKSFTNFSYKLILVNRYFQITLKYSPVTIEQIVSYYFLSLKSLRTYFKSASVIFLGSENSKNFAYSFIIPEL